ncbi:MAG: Sau3AI family type II restriction endonuclease [Acholeplasmataceae bacterium]|nr:Sau3AI family type II restriction endonuclease [Acholeplasmataceae bacterium]
MNDNKRYLNEDEILEITKNAMRKTFGDFGLDLSHSPRNKGGLGGFVEERIFGYKANSDENPDFIEAGIELKVTPVKKNQNGTVSSKERLVLNMINYQSEAISTFTTSSFFKKNRKLLIWFYLYSKGVHPSMFEITDYLLLEFKNSLEYKVIERDWNIIHKKIVEGKAHEISESDTEFLAACTKGANSSVLVNQFKSDIKAKPRAYSFKTSFMTHLYRNMVHNIAPYSPLISEDEWMKNPLEEIYKEKLSIYHGMTQQQLCRKFVINTKAKQLNFMLSQKMLGISGNDNATSEMEAAGIIFRTITVDKNGRPTESMPFKAFEFEELIDTPWEESSVREDFVDLKLMLFVFKEMDGDIIFDKVVFWNAPNYVVDGTVRQMYEHCADLVRRGEAFYFDSIGKVLDKFPKERRNSNGVCHVRPHAKIKADVHTLPIPDKITGIVSYTKQSFWFNKDFIEIIIQKSV